MPAAGLRRTVSAGADRRQTQAGTTDGRITEKGVSPIYPLLLFVVRTGFLGYAFQASPKLAQSLPRREDMDMLQFNISIVVTAEAVALILFFLLRFCG